MVDLREDVRFVIKDDVIVDERVGVRADIMIDVWVSGRV